MADVELKRNSLPAAVREEVPASTNRASARGKRNKESKTMRTYGGPAIL
jgi:hypothetical protein